MYTRALVVCGGGAHNHFLIETIKNCLTDFKVTTTSDYGLDPDSVEAVTFAWLAKQRLEKKPGNISSVTGAAEQTILGCIYN